MERVPKHLRGIVAIAAVIAMGYAMFAAVAALSWIAGPVLFLPVVVALLFLVYGRND